MQTPQTNQAINQFTPKTIFLIFVKSGLLHLVWSLHLVGSSPPKHAVSLLESGSESVFFPPLAWFGARREHRLHRTCVISSRHYTCGATSSPEVSKSLHRRWSSTQQGGRRIRFYAN